MLKTNIGEGEGPCSTKLPQSSIRVVLCSQAWAVFLLSCKELRGLACYFSWQMQYLLGLGGMVP